MAFVERIRAKNILSFGEPGLDLELRDLNVLIGPNSSGKSNLVSLFALLQAAPTDITKPLSAGGGVGEWLWKGGRGITTAELEVVAASPLWEIPLRYALSFREEGQRFSLVDERLENDFRFFYRLRGGRSTFSVVDTDEEEPGELEDLELLEELGELEPAPGLQGARPTSSGQLNSRRRILRREEIQPNHSVLAQRKGPEQYPEITFVADAFSKVKIFQDWQFSSASPARRPQGTDLPNDYLLEDASNLALVVDDIKFSGHSADLQRYLELANPDFRSPVTRTTGGTIQLYIEESGLKSPTPATRLSQGALQLLCLLAVLQHPRPPKLVCIEEPEKGLHPDILPDLAKLMVEASRRTQLVITTHSEVLVDALSDQPEAVIVCEKKNGATSMKRLDKGALKEWLDEYKSLGPLWRSGQIGGNRW